jgi:hypothetical protein
MGSLNWTNVTLYLNRSKLICLEITSMIDKWICPVSSNYTLIHVFSNGSIPVAEVVHQEYEEQGQKYKPSASPLAIY